MYENLTTELFIIQNHFFQLPPIKELGDAAFNFVFEGSDMLAKVTEGLDPETCESKLVVFLIIFNRANPNYHFIIYFDQAK